MTYSAKSRKNGTEYFLHARVAADGTSKLYFFAKEVKEGNQETLPEGYEVAENTLTGLPILKKKQ